MQLQVAVVQPSRMSAIPSAPDPSRRNSIPSLGESASPPPADRAGSPMGFSGYGRGRVALGGSHGHAKELARKCGPPSERKSQGYPNQGAQTRDNSVSINIPPQHHRTVKEREYHHGRE